jgi:uncharacterized phage protein (TIGR01671 family)
MNDRYLFKAKRVDNGEWVQGNLIQSCDATDGWESIIIPAKNSNMFAKHIGHGYGNLGFENWYRVNPSTICRCTGSKDKNGELIYENDIMKNKHNSYRVVWDNEEGSWMLELDSVSLYGLGEANSKKYEVIGNIFDNPQLLESEE